MWFSLAHDIVILPRKLYCYQIRAGSTNNFEQQNNQARYARLPQYLRDLCPCYTNVKELEDYYQLASYFLMLKEFLLFLENLNDKELRDLLQKAFVPLLVSMSLGLVDFSKDPLALIPQLPILKPYVTQEIRRNIRTNIFKQCALYYPHFFPFLTFLIPLATMLRNIERKIRHKLKNKS